MCIIIIRLSSSFEILVVSLHLVLRHFETPTGCGVCGERLDVDPTTWTWDRSTQCVRTFSGLFPRAWPDPPGSEGGTCCSGEKNRDNIHGHTMFFLFFDSFCCLILILLIYKVATNSSINQFFVPFLAWSGMKIWLGFPFRRPGSSTIFLAWCWITVWRTGSSTTPAAAVICRHGKSSPQFGTLRPTQRTGEWSYLSTWWFTLRLPASHSWSSLDTRQCSIPENWGTFHTLWWRTGRSSHFFKQVMS